MRRSAWTAALVLALAGCDGGEEGGAPAPTGAAPTTEEQADRRFPVLRVAYDGALDFLDPRLSYSIQGWQALWNVYLPLLTYRHVEGPEGAELIPGLAESLPEISRDGRTYRLRLREGLRYSNGRPVRASDFRATVRRLGEIGSPGAAFYAKVEEIRADDDARTILVRLAEPQADFRHVLATLFAVPVPGGGPPRDAGGRPLPSTGPYRILRYDPGESFVLARNEHWQPIEGVPDGNPDRIDAVIVAGAGEALQRTLRGAVDYDAVTLPLARVEEIRERHGDRLRTFVPSNVYYLFMNVRVPPFDERAVRRAVNHALDRDAVAALYGGLAEPTQNVLPPTYPQFQALDLYPFDRARARALVREAAATGAKVTVWTSNLETSRRPAEYAVEALNDIGLRATLKVVDASVYFTTIADPATRAQIGVANWFQDLPHPLNWFDQLLYGGRPGNYTRADVEAIDAEIDRLRHEPVLNDAVNRRWAELDRTVMEHALWAPLVNRAFTDFFSERVDTDCYVNHVLYQLDLAQLCVREAAGG